MLTSDKADRDSPTAPLLLKGVRVREEPTQEAVRLEFRGVDLHAPTKRSLLNAIKRRKPEPKQILHKVSGTASPGQFVAILGASGSGKSSLLNTLSGRSEGTVEGQILFNGRQWSSTDYSDRSGYVMQEDNLLPHLTVRETLEYVARLRLSTALAHEEKMKRVDRVIMELGLDKCANTKIGGGAVRGVSGGERRRVSIGVQLLLDPEVMFVDEPTSGLDASTALAIVEVLRDLAIKGGRTILCTIHQPRSDIFALLDKIMLLSRGEVIYFGPGTEVVGHFGELGHQCPERMNPLDYIVDTVVSEQQNGTARSFAQQWRDSEMYRSSGFGEELEAELAPKNRGLCGRPMLARRTARPGCLTQFWVLLARSTVSIVRNQREFLTIFLQFWLLGIVIGTLFWQLQKDYTGLRDRLSLCYVLVIQLPFLIVLSAVSKVCNDRDMVYRETRDGLYGMFPHYCAKVISEVPMYFSFSFFYGLCVYWPAGLDSSWDKYLYFTLLIWLLVNCSYSLAMACAFGIRDFQKAAVACQLVFSFFIFPSGFLVNIKDMPAYVSWLRHVSFVRYGLEGLARNEFTGSWYCGMPGVSYDNCPSFARVSGLSQAVEYYHMGDVTIWEVVAILVFIIAVFHTIAVLFATRVTQRNSEQH